MEKKRTTTWTGSWLRLLFTAALCLGILAAAGRVQAAELNYLALGDSITTGYGLTNASSEVFVAQFATKIGATTTTNEGVPGDTSSDLLGDVQDDSSLRSAIAEADVITITIGGNDLMAAFYAVLAEITAADENLTTYSSEQIQSILSNPTGSNLAVAATLLNVLNTSSYRDFLLSSSTFQTAISNCISNITSIISEIKTLNSGAVILVANQYNPYQWLDSSYLNIIKLFDEGVSALNKALAAAGEDTYDYTIVDIYSAFADDAYASTSLTNAEVDTSSLLSPTLNFDFHPNVTGHTVIAEAMYAAYQESVYTYEVPIELTISKGGSASVPEQEFTLEVMGYDEQSPSITMVQNTVSTTGEATYTGTLTFTCNKYTFRLLIDGFYVHLAETNIAGWTCDSQEYVVYPESNDSNTITSFRIYTIEDTDQENSLSAAAFTCTYTGWTLRFETSGGSEVSGVTAANGTNLSLAQYTTSRDGYTFTGWYTDSTLAETVDQVTLTADTTVYAGWKEIAAATTAASTTAAQEETEESTSLEETKESTESETETEEETTETEEEDTAEETEEDTEESEETTKEASDSSDSPQTGDSSQLILWFVLFITACILSTIVALIRPRKEEE
ncbi:MAG: GDSL-type esterase/lipase family protein [Lachnospiraceae bacterium]|nr:GDSL-type esterase/lipase family protein [Lachnospiraceae bacterium]